MVKSPLAIHAAGGMSEFLVSSGLLSGALVSEGERLLVQSGGSVAGAVVAGGGAMILFGGSAAGTEVLSGGILIAFPGADVTETSVQNGAEVVSTGVFALGAGGVTLEGADPAGAVLGSGVVQYVMPAGVASGASVGSGAEQVVAAGSSLGTEVASGGLEVVWSAGVESGSEVLSGGVEIVSGMAAGDVLSGGTEVLASGGLASGDVVSQGGLLAVSGGVADDTVVDHYGLVSVSYGGLADGSEVFGGGALFLEGGDASGTVVESGGAEVGFAGSSFGAVVESGEIEWAFASAALDSGTVVDPGGEEYVNGRASAVTVLSGGLELVYDLGSAAGTVVEAGGIEEVHYSGTVAGTVLSGGMEFVLSGGMARGTEVLSGGTQIVESGGAVVGTELAPGGAIDLAYFAFAGGARATLVSGTLLEVSAGGEMVSLTLGSAGGDVYFTAKADGSGGTLIAAHEQAARIESVSEAVMVGTACFLRGTRIEGERGGVAVEDLAIGDLVKTAEGLRPVWWIGRRRYEAGVAGADVMPVRVRRGALADGVPRRDLLVSPLHALFLDGVLIPAGALVNGGSIDRPPREGKIAYFHVELEAHGVLFAEGVMAESYLDDRNRGMFDNVGEFYALHGDVSPLPGRYCAPREDAGARVQAVRERLRRRGVALGYHPPGSVGVSLRAGRNLVLLPAGTGEMRLFSPSGAVAGDQRRLGALVTGIRLDGAVVALEDASLGAGFHPAEMHGGRSVRWTDGEAVLSVAPVPRLVRCEIEIAALAGGSARAAA